MYSKIIATNLYGDSALSEAGNGAMILLVPNTPINFANNPLVTNKTNIGLTWTDGSNNGGTPILDYRITYDQSTGNYIILVSGL